MSTFLVLLLIGAIIAAQIGGLIPDWLMPWILAGWVLVWAYFCVVRAGYPLIPTAAWAVPVALAVFTGNLFGSTWLWVSTLLGLGTISAMWLSESVRRFWYGRLFRWQPDPS